MKNIESVSGGMLRRAKYEIFRDKKNELVEFIADQLRIWGSYQDIPEDVAVIIDRQFITLGIFGKKIDAFAIEQESSSVPDAGNSLIPH